MKGSMSSKSIPIGTTRKKMYSVEEENLFKRGEELIKVLNEGIKENNQGQFIINTNIFLNLKFEHKTIVKSMSKPNINKSKPKSINTPHRNNDNTNSFKEIYHKQFNQKFITTSNNQRAFHKKVPRKEINLNTSSLNQITLSTLKRKKGAKTSSVPKSPSSKKATNITTTRSKSNISISSLKSAHLKSSSSMCSYRTMSKQFSNYKNELYNKK